MLEVYRAIINSIDTKIKNALIERYNIVIQIKNEKERLNLPILNKSREDKVLELVRVENNEMLDNYVRNIFVSIMNESKSIQKNE
jgi:chorismate mutase